MLSCTCIKDHREALRKEFGPETELTNTQLMFTLSGGKHYETLEPLRFRFHPKLKDGTYSKKWQRSFVHLNFCPFCGASSKSASKKKRK